MRDQKQTKTKKIKHIVSFEGVKILKSFTNCEWSTPQDSQWDIFLGDFFAAKTRWNIIRLNSRITCELMWSVAGPRYHVFVVLRALVESQLLIRLPSFPSEEMHLYLSQLNQLSNAEKLQLRPRAKLLSWNSLNTSSRSRLGSLCR